MNDSPGPILTVSHLVKTYASASETLEILMDINFSLPVGESLAIMGQSGSGKSTLLNILGGLDRCDSGEVLLYSGSPPRTIDITNLPEHSLTAYRRSQVGFIFQFHYLLKDFTALENVMLPAYIAGAQKKAALEKARSLLADVRLSDRLRHYPSQLSGGERQRVAVARSIINDPDLVLADEPTGNLDPGNSRLVAELLYSLTEKWGKSLIVVTHDEEVASRAVRRLTLEGGLLRGEYPESSDEGGVNE
jgi:lipoprotein-releasing system ATP-binding protein